MRHDSTLDLGGAGTVSDLEYLNERALSEVELICLKPLWRSGDVLKEPKGPGLPSENLWPSTVSQDDMYNEMLHKVNSGQAHVTSINFGSVPGRSVAAVNWQGVAQPINPLYITVDQGIASDSTGLVFGLTEKFVDDQRDPSK